MPLPLCCRVDDENSAEALEADGWRFIEILQTWRGTVVQHSSPMVEGGLPFAWKADHTRLHKDPNVSDADAERRRMMDAAAAKGQCFVIGSDAFVVFHGQNPTVIDFLAVHERSRRQGLAKMLLHHIGGDIMAGTQDTNESAKAFYRDRGFRVVKSQKTYHK